MHFFASASSPPLSAFFSAFFLRTLRLFPLSFLRPLRLFPLSFLRPLRLFPLSFLRTLRLFSAFSPAGPKGCSKDDERVLKGCLCLCHPSHNLFFCRKLLHGTILFPKFSAKVILFFDICKFCTTVLSTFYIFYLIFRTLRPLARNTISVK